MTEYVWGQRVRGHGHRGLLITPGWTDVCVSSQLGFVERVFNGALMASGFTRLLYLQLKIDSDEFILWFMVLK